MALKIDELRSEQSSRAVFVAAKTLYLDADDNVLTQADVDALCTPGWDEDRDKQIPAPGFFGTMLVREGSSIPMAVAEAYGLGSVTPAVAEGGEHAASVTMDEAAAPTVELEASDRPTGFRVTTGVAAAEPEAEPGDSVEVNARMAREELNAIAIAEGIDNPEAMDNKGDVLAAIEEGRSE